MARSEKGIELFDMRPYFIEKRLKLRNPIYSETAAYGHMGRKPKWWKRHSNLPMEKRSRRK